MTRHEADYKQIMIAAQDENEGGDVLDKIRAEIIEEIISHSGTGEEVIQAYADGLKKGLRIIDKYAESEE